MRSVLLNHPTTLHKSLVEGRRESEEMRRAKSKAAPDLTGNIPRGRLRT